MIIKCPVCGPRDLSEFTFYGDATVKFPALDNTSNEDWYASVYERGNPKDWHDEYFQHSGGCRSWLIVRRHTVTHEIESVRLANPTKRVADTEAVK